MPPGTVRGKKPEHRVFGFPSEQFEGVFEHAPCMMHILDSSGRVVRVNRRWLDIMGYRSEEVLGRKPRKFLTPSSYRKFSEQAFPAFWRRGSAENIEYQFVTKEGRVVDVLLDAELSVDKAGNRFGLGTIRLAKGRTRKEGFVLRDLAERFDDMALSLRIIARAQQEGLDIMSEQVQELTHVAKDIERNLRQVADSVAASASRPNGTVAKTTLSSVLEADGHVHTGR